LISSAPTEPATALPGTGAIAAEVGGVHFRLATPGDDDAIRAFLRAHAMDGTIRLATATEPSFFSAVRLLGDRADVLVAIDRGSAGGANEALIGLGVRTVRDVYLSGKPARLAYLSLLRVSPVFRRRRNFLRTGYTLLAALHARDPADITLTAILKDNLAARRLLEAGHRGLPTYTPVSEIHTFTLGTRRRLSGSGLTALPLTPETRPEVLDLLCRAFSRLDAAPVLRPGACDHPLPGGVGWQDFLAVRRGGRLVAAGALWDQRTARQLLVTGYASPLRQLRPLVNLFRTLRGHPRLPTPGQALDLAYVSQLAVDPAEPEAFLALLGALAHRAALRGIDYLTLSLPAAHPLRKAAARIASHTTESILYSVVFPGAVACAVSPMPYVEAGLL
jgi:hypothetical protein